MDPTPDTPQERDDKATALVIERDELAAVIATSSVATAESIAGSFKRLRREMWFLWAATFFIVVVLK